MKHVAAIILACIFLCPNLPAQDADEFTIIALPDTQFYSRWYPEIAMSQTRWIAANRNALNIKFVLGLGDIVDGGGETFQWQRADASIDVLDAAGIPYLLVPGNHDYDSNDPENRTHTTYYNRWFGRTRYEPYAWHKGSFGATNENHYAIYQAGGREWLVIGMEYYPRDAVIAWAADVIEQHPNSAVILTTHSYLDSDGTKVGRCEAKFPLTGNNDGYGMWAKLASRYKNVKLVLSGHIGTREGAARRADLGIYQNLVNQIQSDYQGYANGGNGWLRIMRVRPALNKIEVKTYSPWLNQYKTGANHQFTVDFENRGQFSGRSGSIRGKVRNQQTCAHLASSTVTSGSTSVATDGGGHFVISGLAKGSHSAEARYTGLVPASKSAVVQEGLAAEMVIFLSAGGKIAGKIVDQENHAVPGASVTLKGGSVATTKTVVSDGSGQYSSGTIAVGDYGVSVAASGFRSTASTAKVGAGTVTGLGFTLARTTAGTTVQGTVVNASTGTPVGAAQVTLGERETVADSSGFFRFTDVSAGRFALTAQKTGFLPRSTTLDVGSTTISTTMRIATAGKISGTVKNSSGQVMPDKTVTIKGGVLNQSFTVKTGSSGTFLTSWIPVGTYTVSSVYGTVTASTQATVTDGATASVTLRF